jgi:hypothetical protein
MTTPTHSRLPADITLSDLERAACSPQTWQVFPWGLSGTSGQRRIRDQLVIVNPTLPPDQRRRQLTVVRSWIPLAEGTLFLAAAALPLALGYLLHSFWPLLGLLVPALWLSDYPASSSGLIRYLVRVFDNYAPSSGRVVLGGTSRYGQINSAAARLHQVLLNLAFEHRRWITATDPDQEQQIHAALWSALQEHSPADLVSLSAYLDQKAVHPLDADRPSSTTCPAPATCCHHRPPAGEWT